MTREIAFFALLQLPVFASPETVFEAQVIDDKITVGYGLALADVDGDGKVDILLADSDRTVAYRAPEWTKHELTGKLTERDHVCLCAKDITGDGKAEIVLGAEWNPGDTKTSGAVFSLNEQADCFAPRSAKQHHHEPTVHRMHWVAEANERHFLAVLPLHGPGNRKGEGEGINFLGYRPDVDPAKDWRTFLIHKGFHLAHNFDPVRWDDSGNEHILVACKEGVQLLSPAKDEPWKATAMTKEGAGEVRLGTLPNGKRFIVTIEPMHGNEVVINPEAQEGEWSAERMVIDDTLNQGHALVTGDFLGLGYDQVVAGWRMPTKEGKKVGLRLYAPTDREGSSWKLHTVIDDNVMACEDLKAGDLNGDGRIDLVASGRSTKNVIIYWNKLPAN
ncbi:MAG: FG-GAP repeat domain-containing protein [Verrucomicrobiaceae bacterium]